MPLKMSKYPIWQLLQRKPIYAAKYLNLRPETARTNWKDSSANRPKSLLGNSLKASNWAAVPAKFVAWTFVFRSHRWCSVFHSSRHPTESSLLGYSLPRSSVQRWNVDNPRAWVLLPSPYSYVKKRETLIFILLASIKCKFIVPFVT